MIGIPIAGPAILLGDNQSVITSSTSPHSTLNKRHNALAYHRVRESIAAKILQFYHIPGIENPADILTKFLPYSVFCPLVEILLFWKGDTKPNSTLQRGVTGGTTTGGGRTVAGPTGPGDGEENSAPPPGDAHDDAHDDAGENSGPVGMYTHTGPDTEWTVVKRSIRQCYVPNACTADSTSDKRTSHDRSSVYRHGKRINHARYNGVPHGNRTGEEHSRTNCIGGTQYIKPAYKLYQLREIRR